MSVLWQEKAAGALGENKDAPAFFELAHSSIRAECQRQHGLNIKQPSVKRVLSNALEAKCVVCDGDVCQSVTVRIPFVGGKTVDAAAVRKMPLYQLMQLLPPPIADGKITMALLLQPLSLLAVAGMMLLGACITYEHPATNMLLMLIGGRHSVFPATVLFLAQVAHGFEACIALYVASKLPRVGTMGAINWSLLVFLVGFPVLRTRSPLPPASSLAPTPTTHVT